ncbi:MAG: hypothetical protein RLZZ458_2560 [Planctomycetota bacterium]|jgi:hypothetical protein
MGCVRVAGFLNPAIRSFHENQFAGVSHRVAELYAGESL